MFRHITRAWMIGACIGSPFVLPLKASAQSFAMDSLVAHALVVNPRVRAAESRFAAAQSRIGPAGAWPDPMLMAGIQNLPLSREPTSGHGTSAGPDPMTMKMVGVSQAIPYPGKSSLRSNAARAEAEAADARRAIARLDVRQEVLHAYYDLVAARMLLGIVARQQQVANGVLPAMEARYVAGTAAQVDVLKARTEAAMLLQERNAATEDERAALARINAALDRPSRTVVAADSFPPHVVLAKPLPSLDSLQALALQTNPRLRERRAAIALQTAQTALAAGEYLPDFDVSLQYGHRDRLPGMVTAMVSVPVRVQRSRKQSATAQAARFDLAASEADLRAEENTIRSELARTYATMERHRANLTLLEQAIVPQARATFSSASATYQSGRGGLLGVLDAMRALFATESMYVRMLADRARSLADLDALVGAEVVP